jgi:formylmethanofuran dehydrogenase subunit C
MNKINFTAKDNFPLSSDTMEMMQQMIGLNANLALLGGTNYILSGCVDDGTNVTDGIIVVDGELIPFEGGIKNAKITKLNVIFPKSFKFIINLSVFLR